MYTNVLLETIGIQEEDSLYSTIKIKSTYTYKTPIKVSIVLKNLPFSLTDGQMNAWLEIESDMSSNITMIR